MEVHDYLPRVFEGESNFVGLRKVDSSKWNAIHEAIDNPGSEVIVQSRSSIGSLFSIAWILGIALGLTWIMRNGRTVLTQWQQNMYRRANRRRHGIPDSDDRPFNVAYAAAAFAKKEKQRLERERAKPQIAADTRNNSTNSLRFRQSMSSEHFVAPIQQAFPLTAKARISEFDTSANHPVLPGGYVSDNQGSQPQQRRLIQSTVEPLGQRRLGHPVGLRPQEKHGVATSRERIAEPPKRSASRREAVQASSRGFKRQVDEGDQWETSLDKRARVGSTSYQPPEQEDVEMAHTSSDVEPSKGTKRDREELESTPDSGADETDESPQPRRIRPRREPAERKPSHIATAQVHKRRHSPEESTASDERDRNDVHVSKQRRRHSKAVLGHDTTESEAEEVQEYSEDPACIGRKIGEVWEVNGQTFKVGLDGRRLRQVLVKQRRSKFPMPRDSNHSDVRLDVEVYVEKWLNDEEYKSAKENRELAWQDPPAPTRGTPELRQSTGKRLLWDGPPKSPVKGRKSMLPASVQNPFDLAASNASRRASSVHAGHAGENPQLKTSRSFSKWEKQDLEALSLKKMRERMEKEKAQKEQVKTEGKKQGFPTLGDGKLNIPTTAVTLPGSAPTVTEPSNKQTGTTVSFVPTLAATTPTSIGPMSGPGTVPAKPVFSFAKDAESKSIPGTAPAPTPSFAPNKPTPEVSKSTSTPPSFNFAVTPVPSSTTTATSAPPGPSNLFNFGATTSTPAQDNKPGPPKSTFSFQPSPSTTTPGSNAAKPFNPPSALTGSGTTSSSSTEPAAKPFSFAPTQVSVVKPAQSVSTATQSTTPMNFNFAVPPTGGSEVSKFTFGSSGSTSKSTPPPTSGSEPAKFTFGNSPKPTNESIATTTAPAMMVTQSTSTTETANPPKFSFGQPPSFPQATPGAFGFGKPSTDAAGTITAAPTAAPNKPAESANALFGRLGSQASAPSSTPSFGGFGAADKSGQATTSGPMFNFGATATPETMKPATSSLFAPSGEQSKTSHSATSNEPPKSIFGGQTNPEIPKPNSTFGASPSAGQNAFGGQTPSEPPKSVFGGFQQPSGTSVQTSDPKNPFGQPSQKPPFGQPPQTTSAFGQSSEPKSAFGQPSSTSSEAPKTLFTQGFSTEPSKPVFGHTSTLGADTSKNVFGQGGQPSEPPKPAFGQTSAPSSTFSFGNANAGPSSGSAGNTSNPSVSSNNGFNFSFGSGTSTPNAFTGFGGAASGNKPNIFEQPKAIDGAGATGSTPKPTPVFGQTSVFNPSSASSPTFGQGNSSNSGLFGQASGSSTFGNPSFSFGQASQSVGASTSGTQIPTPPSSGIFDFKSNEQQKK